MLLKVCLVTQFIRSSIVKANYFVQLEELWLFHELSPQAKGTTHPIKCVFNSGLSALSGRALS